MWKWLTGPEPAAVLARRAILAATSALVATGVDQGLLNDALGRAVVRVVNALFGL